MVVNITIISNSLPSTQQSKAAQCHSPQDRHVPHRYNIWLQMKNPYYYHLPAYRDKPLGSASFCQFLRVKLSPEPNLVNSKIDQNCSTMKLRDVYVITLGINLHPRKAFRQGTFLLVHSSASCRAINRTCTSCEQPGHVMYSSLALLMSTCHRYHNIRTKIRTIITMVKTFSFFLISCRHSSRK